MDLLTYRIVEHAEQHDLAFHMLHIVTIVYMMTSLYFNSSTSTYIVFFFIGPEHKPIYFNQFQKSDRHIFLRHRTIVRRVK